MGSTISPDGSYLYFSAEVRDPSIDPSVYYANRVCRYEISTGIFQTYNKTLVERMPPAGGYTMDVYEGDIAKLKLVACNLKTDANGNLFFLNNYCSALIADGDEFVLELWHNTMVTGSGNNYYVTEILTRHNICKLSGQQVQSVIKDNDGGDTSVPGYAAGNTYDYCLSLQGSSIYVIHKENSSGTMAQILEYDYAANDPVLTTDDRYTYRFYSFDTAQETTFPVNPFQVQGFSFAESRVLYYDEVQQLNIQPLPDGTLITNMYQSLVAVDTKQRTERDERLYYICLQYFSFFLRF